jgi:peroxiredoxin
MVSARKCARLLVLLFLAACSGMTDDLAPSGDDKRPTVQEGTTGPAVGQRAPDFTLPDTLGGTFTLSSALPAKKGVVLYFTMWCPVCDEHMSHLRSEVIPHYPDVGFYAVDFVSGSVAQARDAQVSSGYANAGFTVLADTEQAVYDAYNGSMGCTVVVDGSGVVRMNEDYKNGARLEEVLKELP